MSSINGHCLMTTLFVDGIDKGDAYGIRMPASVDDATNPVC